MYSLDFCLYSSPTANLPIADSEGYEVAWCTRKKDGARLIPQNAMTGVQFLNNSNYIQIVVHINQVAINLPANDTGGELDPHGADGVCSLQSALESCRLIACPKGRKSNGCFSILDCFQLRWCHSPTNHRVESVRLLFSSLLSSTHLASRFIGANLSAAKICNPAGPNPLGYCLNTLDRLGIAYNMPNNAQDGVFEVCDSDAMELPGVYTSNGQTLTYTQPDESLGPITTVPYTPTVPSSSNCQTFQSTDLYTDTISGYSTTTSASSPTGKVVSGSSGTRTGSSSPASSTSGSNGAGVVTISLFSTILGVAFSVAFLA